MPKGGDLCPHTGLSRSFLYQLANEGKIRTVSLRRRGMVRGVRLVDLGSLLDYIRKRGVVNVAVDPDEQQSDED